MLEYQEPLLGLGTLVEPTARLERDERLQVVAHDPRQRQVRRRGHEIRQKADAFATTLYQDRLVKRHVSGCRDTANALQDFRLAIDQLKGHTLEIVGEIAARRSFVGVLCELELTTLNDVAGLG